MKDEKNREEKKSSMFKLWNNSRIATVNSFNGCEFKCYDGNCWAKQMAKRQKAMGTKGYKNGFNPSFVPERMEVPNTDVVWIGSMGDIAFQKTWVIDRIIDDMIVPNPEKLFFLETKKPSTYNRFIGRLPENVMISTTIETNRTFLPKMGKAPAPRVRWKNFRDLDWDKKHISIEPIMDFDIDVIEKWVRDIGPDIISIGYDNYNCGLTEPSLSKTKTLIKKLEEFTQVERKTLGDSKNER